MNRLRFFILFPLMALLEGCSTVVLDPSGDVAVQQRDLLIESTVLMLFIIIPVMGLTAYFAWRYRQSNKDAPYEPDWDHSTQLELVIWGAPLLIVIALGALTWMGTHLLDPYRPIGRIAEGQPITGDMTPLEVDVVALDWKWLFIYPQYGIATVNELAAPVDRPIDFRITSSSVMNSFYIPALAGQIYAMPAMETRLHAVINKPGDYLGFSANYSGAGFSGMHFPFHSVDSAGFDQWVASVKTSSEKLDRTGYLQLEQPSENEKARHYATVDAQLFKLILNLCVQPGKMCMNEMMSIDSRGGGGRAGIENVIALQHDKNTRPSAVFGPPPSYPVTICTKDDVTGTGEPTKQPAAQFDLEPVLGVGLPHPLFTPIRMPTATLLFGQSRPSNS